MTDLTFMDDNQTNLRRPKVQANKKTWQIMDEAQRLVMEMTMEGGEITDDLITRIDSLVEEADDKFQAIRAVFDRLGQEREFQKMMKQRHADYEKRLAKQQDRMKALAAGLLKSKEEMGEEPTAHGSWGKAWLASSTRAEVSADIEDIPVRYLKEAKPTVNKTLAKEDLLAGKEIPGISLVETRSVRWR